MSVDKRLEKLESHIQPDGSKPLLVLHRRGGKYTDQAGKEYPAEEVDALGEVVRLIVVDHVRLEFNQSQQERF